MPHGSHGSEDYAAQPRNNRKHLVRFDLSLQLFISPCLSQSSDLQDSLHHRQACVAERPPCSETTFVLLSGMSMIIYSSNLGLVIRLPVQE